MRCWSFCFWSPGIALPVGGTCWSIVAHAFPQHIAVWRECCVGEKRVAPQCFHCIGVGVVAGSWRNTKEAGFWVDGVQTAIFAKFHPANIVTNGFCFPTWNGRNKHGEVGLATSGRKCRCNVFGNALRVGEFQNEHVLGKPSVVTSHDRGNAQRKALLAKQCVAAVARTKAPNFTSLREVNDVLVVGVAWP